jgi:DNA (cytosine-5)-methyltransferase 1
MNCVDIFSGCGGLTLGLHKAGIHGLFAIEKSPDAFLTLKINLIDRLHHFAWPQWLPQQAHDINMVLKEFRPQLEALRGQVDLLAGGPPCQGFSLAGRRRHEDKRNKLVHSYIAMVDAIQPKCLLLENVKGFTIPFTVKGEMRQYSSLVVDELKRRHYDVAFQLIDFSRFGVPQKRTRFILIGVSQELQAHGVRAEDFFAKMEDYREVFLQERKLPLNGVSVKSAISDLCQANGVYRTEEFKNFDFGEYGKLTTSYQRLMRRDVAKGQRPDSHRFARHTEEVQKRFQVAIDESLSPTKYREKFALNKSSTKHLIPQAPTPTLTTLPDDYIHYCEPRILTVREYARIQSFPDDYVFRGKYTTGGKMRVKEVPRYSQIGNAIPPLFGEMAGQILMEMCDGRVEV